MPNPIPLPPALRDAILDWYVARGRSLPFRDTADPWAILVSEAMAQQTQAARAGETWIRFMDRFPTPLALATATPADVLRAWQGLGYNRRALSLWRASRQIVELHGGRVPAGLAALQALPGVGPYTSRAVAALGFGLAVGAVDTNVRRVLGRIVAGDASALAPAALQAVADAAVPPDRPGEWTQALMDLGATVCRPRRPDCPACPARSWCRYVQAGRHREQAAREVGQRRAAREAGPAAAPTAHESGRAMLRTSVREVPAAFATTSRWLRGRIIDRLRAAPDGRWVLVAPPIGQHDEAAVAAALEALARDGLLELDRPGAGGAVGRPAGRRARLPLSDH